MQSLRVHISKLLLEDKPRIHQSKRTLVNSKQLYQRRFEEWLDPNIGSTKSLSLEGSRICLPIAALDCQPYFGKFSPLIG